MKRFFFIVLICHLVPVFIITGLWYFGVPDKYILSRIESVGGKDIKINVRGFKKGLFFRLSADEIIVSVNGKEALELNNFKTKLILPGLLKGRAVFEIKGKSYEGDITGEVSYGIKDKDIIFFCSDIQLSKNPYLKSMNIVQKGRFTASFFYEENKGELKFTVSNARLNDFTNNDLFVPLHYFKTIRGAVDILSPEYFEIKSIACEGKGIYVRLKGAISRGRADMIAEIMPEPCFDDYSLFGLMEKYKVSDGYYKIPVNSRAINRL